MTNPAHTAPETTGNAMEDVIQSAWKDTMLESGVKEEDLARDEHGRFRPREETPEEQPEKPKKAAKPAEKPVEGEETDEKEPVKAETKAKDGEPAKEPALKPADPSKLATKFTLKDAEGELDVPDGLIIEFQANGKTRAEPLDRVVKFAQMGVYNHEREQRMQQTEHRAQEVETYAQSLEQQVAERERQMEALLADEAYRERAIAEYQNLQTPEQKAARLERERQEFRAEQERSQLAQVGTQYYQTQIVPAIEAMGQAVPNVTPQEIADRLAPFVNRMKGPLGIVPPDRYEAINQHFLTEIVPWAQQLDEHRALDRGTTSGRQQVDAKTAAEQAKDAELADTKVRAQKARRIATANLKPVGRGAAQAPPKAKTPVTRDEIMEDVIQSTKAAMAGSA